LLPEQQYNAISPISLRRCHGRAFRSQLPEVAQGACSAAVGSGRSILEPTDSNHLRQINNLYLLARISRAAARGAPLCARGAGIRCSLLRIPQLSASSTRSVQSVIIGLVAEFLTVSRHE
jgi:hypothetical protein